MDKSICALNALGVLLKIHMFSAFDNLSLRTRTTVVLIFALVGVSLQIWQVLHEPRQGVQILYVIVAVGFVVVAGMILSSIRSIDRYNTKIKRIKNEIHEVENQTKEKRLFTETVKTTMLGKLREMDDTNDKLKAIFTAQNDEPSRRALSALSDTFSENKRLIKELESI